MSTSAPFLFVLTVAVINGRSERPSQPASSPGDPKNVTEGALSRASAQPGSRRSNISMQGIPLRQAEARGAFLQTEHDGPARGFATPGQCFGYDGNEQRCLALHWLRSTLCKMASFARVTGGMALHQGRALSPLRSIIRQRPGYWT
jgi:hypothetical protein